MAKTAQFCLDEAESAQDHKAEEPKPDTIFVAGHERKKKRTQAQMLNHLPEEEVLLESLRSSGFAANAAGYEAIGKKFLRHEMQIIPKQVRLLAYYAVTYACDKCEKDTGFARIVSVKPPVPLMKHSLASALHGCIHYGAEVCRPGWPLARQEKIWEREGISLSRATMANWVIQCSQTWLKPLYKHMKQRLLEQSVIHADETVVQVLKEDGKPAASESRMWLYASAALLRHQVRLFEYQPGPQRQAGQRPFSRASPAAW